MNYFSQKEDRRSILYRPNNPKPIQTSEPPRTSWPRFKHFDAFFTDKNWTRANGWKVFPNDLLRERHFAPNIVFYHPALREVMIPLRIKGPPEHAATLGVTLIDHYCQRVQDTHDGHLEPGDLGVAQAWVAFAHINGDYIGSTTIREIKAEIKRLDVEPNEARQPDFPDYYWIDADGLPSSKEAWLERRHQAAEVVF
jgi:hypothetical protein